MRDFWVLLTREEERGLSERLTGAGMRVRSVACTRTEPPEDPGPLHRAVRELGEFDWVVLTSARAAEALASAGARVEGQRPGWACVGPATAGALRERMGVEPDLVPERFDAASLASSMLAGRAGGSGSRRVLFPAADNAREELPAALRAAGMELVQVIAYRTVPAPPPFEDLFPPEGRETWGAVIFTSGLVVRVFFDVLAGALGREKAVGWMARNPVAALGRSASEALERLGVPVAVRPETPSLDCLVEALEMYARRPAGRSEHGG